MEKKKKKKKAIQSIYCGIYLLKILLFNRYGNRVYNVKEESDTMESILKIKVVVRHWYVLHKFIT